MKYNVWSKASSGSTLAELLAQSVSSAINFKPSKNKEKPWRKQGGLTQLLGKRSFYFCVLFMANCFESVLKYEGH